MDIETKRFIFSVRSYYICTSQSFITKCFLIFIVDEVKNFIAKNFVQSFWSQSCTGIRANGQSQIGDLCIKGKGIGVKVQLQAGISGQAKIIGKIPYTCNHLIVDQWILGSGDLKITQWGFCLGRDFPYLSTNYRVNLISVAFSLFGDLLVPSRFSCN